MQKSKTLCWGCKHSVPNFDKTVGCEWSIGFKPVPGWTATPSTRKGANDKFLGSYFVHKCPKFERG